MSKFFQGKFFVTLIICSLGFVGFTPTVAKGALSKNATNNTQDINDAPVLPVAASGTVVLPTQAAIPLTIDISWKPLLERLQRDEPNNHYDKYFTGLEPYSSAPMSTKIKELYTILTRPKKIPNTSTTPTTIPSIYKGFVTNETVAKCRDFLIKNRTAFTLMEKRYNIPREVVVSLLYVETKLGTFLGKDKAFWSLASMAMADSPEKVKEGIASLHIKKEHEAWLQTRLKDKSAWAYKELKALLSHSAANGLDPQSMLGSAYGAIGICQFMPSNISLFGDDGNGDGRVDLYCEADAIVSVGKYFAGHGWKGVMSEANKKKVIKRYNNLNRYANTILALSTALKTGKLPATVEKKIASENTKKKKAISISKEKKAVKGKSVAQKNKKKLVAKVQKPAKKSSSKPQ